jgi:hypothetical protein
VSQTSLEQVFNFHAVEAHDHGKNVLDQIPTAGNAPVFGVESDNEALTPMTVDDLPETSSQENENTVERLRSRVTSFALGNLVRSIPKKLHRSLQAETNDDDAAAAVVRIKSDGIDGLQSPCPTFIPAVSDASNNLHCESDAIQLETSGIKSDARFLLGHEYQQDAPRLLEKDEAAQHAHEVQLIEISRERDHAQIELKRVRTEMQELEEKLIALQDEHVSASARLLSTQRELSSSKEAHDTRIYVEKQKAEHKMELLKVDRADAVARVSKLEADLEVSKQRYETKICDLIQSYSNEIDGLTNDKHEVEDKLLTLQDEHIWTSTRLLSVQNEISVNTSDNETRINLEKQRVVHRMELLEEEKAVVEAKAVKLEADLGRTISDYETKIGNLSSTYLHEIANIRNEKEDAESKLAKLEDKHIWTSQQLATAQNKLLSNTATYETRIKKLECRLEDSTNHLQRKITALQKELDGLKSKQNSAHAIARTQAVPASTASSSLTNHETSDGNSIDSNVVAVASSIDSERNIVSNGYQTHLQIQPTVVTGQSEFVDMSVFDGSSMSSVCSSTSYDA